MPFKKEDTILINDKFFIGGPLSLRGFANRGAGPHKEGEIMSKESLFWIQI